jgi:hypothetical protein
MLPRLTGVGGRADRRGWWGWSAVALLSEGDIMEFLGEQCWANGRVQDYNEFRQESDES